MRLLVVFSIIMLVIVGLGFYVEYGLSELIHDVLQHLDEGEVLMERGNRKEGIEKFQVAEKEWKTAQRTWNPFVYNMDLDEMEASLARLIGYAESDNLADAKVELRYIRTRLNQIRAQESLTIINVL